VTSPTVDRALRAQVRQLLQAAQQRAQGMPIVSVQLLQLAREGKDEIIWNNDTAKNVGFKPQKTIERQYSGAEDRLVGFYTWEVEPLDYTIRRGTNETRTVALTVHLREPLAPQSTLPFFRVERRANSLQQDLAGHWVATLNWPQRSLVGFRVRGMVLPAGAMIVKAIPEEPVTIGIGASPLLYWVASDQQMKKSVVVTFDLK
jgi:hypothetical protein